MAENRPIIEAACAKYACRSCRTKTGWPHQSWCERAAVQKPDCGDCRYFDTEKVICIHPAVRKGGDKA